jgi:hypothetical protein
MLSGSTGEVTRVVEPAHFFILLSESDSLYTFFWKHVLSLCHVPRGRARDSLSAINYAQPPGTVQFRVVDWCEIEHVSFMGQTR